MSSAQWGFGSTTTVMPSRVSSQGSVRSIGRFSRSCAKISSMLMLAAMAALQRKSPITRTRRVAETEGDKRGDRGRPACVLFSSDHMLFFLVVSRVVLAIAGEEIGQIVGFRRNARCRIDFDTFVH